jgi:hypothetical protein
MAALEDAARQPPAIAIDAALRELVLEEIGALRQAIPQPQARARYDELAAAVAAGLVPPPLADRLGAVLEMSLATGRARRRHGPQDAGALQRLFAQTPAGTALRQSAEDANRAVAALAGQRLDQLSFSVAAPGTVRLQVATDRCQVTLEVGRDGVQVTHLGVDL